MVESYSLFELNEYIRRVVALNFAEPIWINCEIGQMNDSSGHIFMDLIQKGEETDELIARAEAVIWKSTVQKLLKKSLLSLEQIIVEGNEIRIKAQVDFHERYGFKLIVEEIDAEYTLGKWLIRRTKVIEQLKKEGIFYFNSQLSLPKVIQNVAVISSTGAAGLQDYLHQIQHNPYQYQVKNTLFSATVQGDKAAKKIAERLRTIALKEGFDIVIIIRGGGARLDLSAFDEYELGKAIAGCPIPVITGIGHDVDQTVADQVAHTDVKTPTAVADFIIHHNAFFESQLEHLGNRIKDLGNLVVKKENILLQNIQQKIIYESHRKKQENIKNIEILEQKLKYKIQSYFQNKNIELEQQEKLLETLNIQSVLKRGYALITQNNNKIKSIDQINIKDRLNIILNDGNIEVEVVHKNKK